MLVKSVLDSLLVYWMSLHFIPSSICNKLEKIRRDFQWGQVEGKEGTQKKLHLVDWTNVCKPRYQGGLGLTPIKIKKLSLLGKWCSRWENERHRNWNIWIRGKYNCTSKVSLSEGLSYKNMSDSLEAIVKAAHHSLFKQTSKHKNFTWILGNGNKILFWEDCWFEDSPLMGKFSRLYSLSKLKEHSVSSFIQSWFTSYSTKDNIWRRTLRAWELEDLDRLSAIVNGVSLSSKEDRLIWKIARDEYSAKKATHELTYSTERIQWEFIWKMKVPNKIKLFLWKFYLNILPTRDLLSKRGVHTKEINVCSFCGYPEETEFHLFQSCPCAINMWKHVCFWWQIRPYYLQFNSLDALWKSSKMFTHKKARIVWKIVLCATLWIIWLSRNAIVFRENSKRWRNASIGKTTVLRLVFSIRFNS